MKRGATMPISELGLRLRLSWRSDAATDDDVDIVALLLGPDGFVRADTDLVFYNAPMTDDGSVRLLGRSASAGQTIEGLEVQLSRVAADVASIVIAAAVTDGVFADVRGLALTASSAGSDGSEFASIDLTGAGRERAYIACELYRRGTGWKLRAVGQGWEAGLPAMLSEYGVAVEEAKFNSATELNSTAQAQPAASPVKAEVLPNRSQPSSAPTLARGTRVGDASDWASDQLDLQRLVEGFVRTLHDERPTALAAEESRRRQTEDAAKALARYAVDPAGRRAYKEARQAQVQGLIQLVDA